MINLIDTFRKRQILKQLTLAIYGIKCFQDHQDLSALERLMKNLVATILERPLKGMSF